MTKLTEKNLIKAIEEFQLDVNNIPIELIEAYKKLRQEFNKIPNDPQPVFTENNIPIDMKNWDYWKFTGLNNWEFIGLKFYLENHDEMIPICELSESEISQERIIKFNNARGAILCNKCNIIVKEDLSKQDYEDKFPVFCKTCGS